MKIENKQRLSSTQKSNKTFATGVPTEVAPGILLFRLPLPTRLNHINVYLLEDEGGWAVIDTGMWHEGCRVAWASAFAGLLSGKPITKLLITHFHLDHVGLAGWLHQRFSPRLLMSQTEYLLSRVFESEEWDKSVTCQAAFFRSCGLDAETAEHISYDRMSFRAFRTPLPSSFERLRAGDSLRIGGREWQVLTGAGHAVEQIMLYAPADRIFLSADQVLPEISPNISVGYLLPDADPLADFLKSLREIKAEVGEEVFVLPAHRTPFIGLHDRIDELARHHQSRCEALLAACRGTALTALDLVPAVFGRSFGTDVIGHATSETVAHANYLKNQGALASNIRPDGTTTYTAT
jgi:glyoxylase-like metal-dependent hydrolase (beta-lactamase superfamily II)